MNLLIYIPTLADGKGGAERVAAELGRNMSRRGHRISFAYQVAHDGDQSQPQYPIPWDAKLIPYSDTLAGWRRLRADIRSIAPDLILVFYANWQLTQLNDAIRDLDIPICYQECSNPWRVIESNWARGENAAQMRMDLLQNASGIRMTQPEYIESLPSGLRDIAVAYPNAFARKETPDRKDIPKTILHVGGRKKNKNLETMLDTFALLHPRFPDWKLLLCGMDTKKGNPKTEKLIDRIERQFIPGSIIMMSSCEDMDSLYTGTGIHCITSRDEGLPNCVCEAMCRGIPSVGFADSRGTNLLIRNGIDGLLAPGDPDGLAAALSNLMSDEDRTRELGANAWKAAASFDPAQIYDRWEHFLLGAAARPRARAEWSRALEAVYSDWDNIRESTWRSYLEKRLNRLEGKVVFFGAGSLYKHFGHLCAHLEPQCIMIDRIEARSQIDGIPVKSPDQLNGDEKALPVIIFCKDAVVVAHRLRSMHGMGGEMICIDRRILRNSYIGNAPKPLNREKLDARREKLDMGESTYKLNAEPLVSRINSEHPACAFCGSHDESVYLTSKTVDWHEGDEFRLVRCKKCNLVYNSPRPPESYAIADVVKNGEYFYKRKLNRENVQNTHDGLASSLLTLDSGIHRVFDIAFGAGTLLKAFNKLGLEASGNEINTYACERMREAGFTIYDLPTRKLKMNSEFDLVTMLDYLEHTYTPFDDLLKAYEMLRPGGYLYLKTLYLGCPSHINKGEAWQLFGRGHLYYYLPRVLAGMVENAGFEILKIEKRALIYITARKPDKRVRD